MLTRRFFFTDQCSYFLSPNVDNAQFHFSVSRYLIADSRRRIKRIWIILFEVEFTRRQTLTALEAGSILSTNIVLIGYSVGTGLVPFAENDIRLVLESIGNEKNRKRNLKAFELGLTDGKCYGTKK